MKHGLYQKQDVSLQEVIDGVSIEENIFPRVVLTVAPCRCATTVLLRVFGANGVPSHFQELKNLLRWLMQGEVRRWTLPQETTCLLLKETLGPYTEIECAFNPLAVLLGAGVPPEMLHLVILGREPYETWASWDAWWKGKTRVELFCLAYRATEQIRRQARGIGVATTCLVYEVFKDQHPETVFRRLFERLDIPFSPLSVRGWQDLPAFGAHGSNIVLPEEPAPFITPGIHHGVAQSSEYVYSSRAENIPGLGQSDMMNIDRSALHAIYENWAGACWSDLGFPVPGGLSR